jgi:hypothetical protein
MWVDAARISLASVLHEKGSVVVLSLVEEPDVAYMYMTVWVEPEGVGFLAIFAWGLWGTTPSRNPKTSSFGALSSIRNPAMPTLFLIIVPKYLLCDERPID